MLFNFSFSVLLYTVALFALLHIYLAVILWYCLISEYISADDSGVKCWKINQKVSFSIFASEASYVFEISRQFYLPKFAKFNI